MKITVSIRELMAAAIFASEDESRYILNGVCVEARPNAAPLIVTTDGRRLCVIESQAEQPTEDKPEDTYEFILKPEFITAMHAMVKVYGIKLFPWVEIDVRPGSKQFRASFMGGTASLHVEDGALIEGTFPQWRGIVPAGEKIPVTQLGLNAEYVGDFQKAAKALEKEGALLSINLFSQNGAMEIRVGGLPNIYAILMPAEVAEGTQYQPEFLGIVKAVEIQAEEAATAKAA